ncbi:MAG: MAE_28990/MAE_18760 family HEPN-like nuclease [Kofleriaceae bacterium]
MPAVDLAALRAEIEEEREWREREMRLFRNQVAALESEEKKRTARKGLVVMLYAHFEGATKAILSMYVNRLNALGLRIHEAVPAIGAASISEVFLALRNTEKKCKEFVRALPDDAALHRFAREREFLEVAWQVAQRPVRMDADHLVDTESNLKPVVLKKIFFRIGLDPALADPWAGALNQLLNRRNAVAHGSERGGLTEKDYAGLEQAVNLVMDDLVRAVSDAVTRESYRSSAATAKPTAVAAATATMGTSSGTAGGLTKNGELEAHA